MITDRVKLSEQLPLETPFSVHIFPTYKCNFKCNYCVHAIPNHELNEKGFRKEVMPFEIYTKAIDGIQSYPSKLKALIFAGHGEPLLHPNICDMIQYAKNSNIAERIEITTNASMLSPEMSDGLIKAGVDRLKISIQGTSKEKYKDIAKHNLDYNKFLSNLKYFNEHKNHTEVYIKIIDIALINKEDEQKFKKMFKPVATYVDIEYAFPFVANLDISNLKNEFNTCKQGNTEKSDICSMPFYMQIVAPNGDIQPCCSVDVPIVLGNVNHDSIKDIWESEQNNTFLKTMLRDRKENAICKSCSVPKFGLQTGDYLDNDRVELLKKYGIKHAS